MVFLAFFTSHFVCTNPLFLSYNRLGQPTLFDECLFLAFSFSDGPLRWLSAALPPFWQRPLPPFFWQLLVRTPARNAAQLPLESALFGAFTGAEYTPMAARLCPNMSSYEDGSMVGAAYLRNRVTAGFARGGIRGVFRLGIAPVSRTACRTGVYRYCLVYGAWGGMR